MPGLAGRRVMYCDVGLKVLVSPDPDLPHDRRPLTLQLGLPFATEDSLTDLVPLFYDDRKMANLVFGNNADAPHAHDGSYEYNDGADMVAIAPIDTGESKRVQVSLDRAFSVWKIQTSRSISTSLPSYMRIRFRVTTAGRTWSWRKVGFRRTFAIADLRVNELREKPYVNPSPDYANDAKSIDQVNVFFAASSKLKAGRVNPQPRYVRLLEGKSWEQYVGRKLGKPGDIFVITYWRKQNVTPDAPFQAFLELERRRPTASQFAILGAAISVSGFLLLESPYQLDHSVLEILLVSGLAWLSSISVAAVVMLVKLVPSLAPKIPKLRTLFRKIEDRRFRLPR